ncbi:MAG: hypothetical protein QOI98_3702, partial [Solirubrobacteraceae bacterium]|nr:hypothetical protein [Solirubrobacteraceae bacterium]
IARLPGAFPKVIYLLVVITAPGVVLARED